MLLEAPKDQYEQAVNLMREKIKEGKVAGVTDPEEAQTLVKAGCVTFKQARNIAKAGNIDSLLFDAKQSVVQGRRWQLVLCKGWRSTERMYRTD